MVSSAVGGAAAAEQRIYMGNYSRLQAEYNDHPAYVKNNGSSKQQLFVYFFSDQWIIGPGLGQIIAGLRNTEKAECVHSLQSDWVVYSASNHSWNPDPTLSVRCRPDQGNVIDHLGSLELNKTTSLTIGLKLHDTAESATETIDGNKIAIKKDKIAEKKKKDSSLKKAIPKSDIKVTKDADVNLDDFTSQKITSDDE